MNKYQMAQEILSLASGTVARLCGSPDYDDIDAYVQAWIEWAGEQRCKTRWPTWQECHEQFVLHLEEVCGGADSALWITEAA